MRVRGWIDRQAERLRAQLVKSDSSFISCVFLVKSLKLSVPFPHFICKMGAVIAFSS